MAKEKDNSISKGFKFALGVILFLVIFFWFFRPSIIVGPIDSEGNIIVPKGTKESVVYSSIPLKEADTTIEAVSQKTISKCGNGICDEEETISSCDSDCKGASITINSYSLESEIGRVPSEFRSIYEQADSSTKQSLKANFFSIAENGKVFLVLDLTIDNQNSEVFQANPVFMKLIGDGNSVYEYSSATVRLENYFDGSIVDKDTSLRGKVAFEIPENEREFEFIIDTFTSTVSVDVNLE
jgi:hypothetical protein